MAVNTSITKIVTSLVLLFMAIIFLAMTLLSPSHTVESHKAVVSHNPPSLVATQPALHTQHFIGNQQTSIILHFTGSISQPVAVPTRFALQYICDGTGSNDSYQVVYQYGQIARGPLHCDLSWHTDVFFMHYPHSVQVKVSRPIDATVVF